MFAPPSITYRMTIVDDDLDTGLSLKNYFEENAYDVTIAEDSRWALDWMQHHEADDIVLLDVAISERSAWEVLQEIQTAWINTPVVMLSPCRKVDCILKAFELGACDYIVKPFNVEELAARIRAILQRTQPPSKVPMEVYQFGDAEVNFSTNTAYRDGDPVHFTTLEFDVLRCLAKHRGIPLSRQQLLRDVWGIHAKDLITRRVDRHIASIREKLQEDRSQSEIIETVYGVGYRLEG